MLTKYINMRENYKTNMNQKFYTRNFKFRISNSTFVLISNYLKYIKKEIFASFQYYFV